MNNFQNFIMVPVNAGNYRWYAIDVTDDFTQLRIEMTHIGTIGDPDLYGPKTRSISHRGLGMFALELPQTTAIMISPI